MLYDDKDEKLRRNTNEAGVMKLDCLGNFVTVVTVRKKPYLISA